MEPKCSNTEFFNLKIHIKSARQLIRHAYGAQVQIHFRDRVFITRKSKSWLHHVWDETTSFECKMAKDELLTESIKIEIIDSESTNAQMCIAYFNLQLSVIYEQHNHTLKNFMLLLTRKSTCSPAGFLHIEAQITKQGEYIEVPKVHSESTEYQIIRQLGVDLTSMVMFIRIFKAEDLPRMDGETLSRLAALFSKKTTKTKDLVDPYVIVKFGKEELRTKTINKCSNPVFNEELLFKVEFPCIHEVISIRVEDEDPCGIHNNIGSCNIPFEWLFDPSDDGYLPTFGPCWVNMIGGDIMESLMENDNDSISTIPVVKRQTYNGRILVAIGTLPSHPDAKKSVIAKCLTKESQTYEASNKYKLCAIVFGGTLLKEMNTSIQLEFSQGNFGDSSETQTGEIGCSMTSPIQPQFDGKSIRRLSWHCNKPFVQVLSQWENTEFRIQEVNRLTNLVEAVNVLKEESASNIGDLEAFMNMMKKQNELVKRRKNIQNDLDRTTQICRGRVLDHCIELCSKIHATKSHESRLELLQRIETMLKEICTEAQQSFPDIVVWMMSGTTRLSYARIPVEKVYFSQDSMTNGSCAGKTVTYKFHSISSNEVDAIMRMRLWFGSLDSHNTYTYDNASIELRAFVEVYENQVKCHDKWSTANYKRDGIFEWSDFYGKNQTLKDAFLLPASLKWLGDWYCEPVTTGAVSDGKLVHKSTIFEFQNRESKTGEWKATTDTGKQHDEVEMECFESVRQNKPPAGWTWLTDWYIDFQRAVDKDGWEYRSPEGTYSASSRLFHISRRRCWLRERAMKSIEKKDTESAHCIANDFWRYSAGVEGSVHEKEKNSDTVRRIRWRRRITVNEEDEVTNAKLNDKLPVIFKIEGHDEFSHKRMSSLTEMYYKNSNTYRLHAYIFQCKRLSIDHKLTDGLSLSITYMGLSQSTAQLDKDSSMIWNEMLIFDKLVLYGSLSDIKSEPPYALVELIDNNNSTIISQKFLKPSTVDLEGSSKEKFKLSWISFKGVSITGEILMGLRLLQNEEYDLNIQRDFKTRFEIPEHIRPQTTHAHLMVFCWGLRESFKGIRVKDLTKPKLIIQVSGKIQELSSLEGLNFQVPAAHFDLNIPLDKQYAPEVIISLIDNKSFGRKSIVGVIRSQLEVCQIQDYSNGLFKAKDNLLAINSVPIPHESVTKFDWWSKFYASSGEIEKCGQYKTRRHATLEVLNGSLEDDMKNNKFEDMCQTYRFKDETKNDATVINMKARIFLCEASKYTDQVSNQLSLDSLPLNSYKCIVRVYIVRAFDLYTTDFDGNPDPYVRLSTSIQAIGDSSGRKSNSRSPLFGLLHEMTVTLPEERLLTVMVYDYNPLTRDDLIGQTCIDIENRIRTFYHAHCGLPEIYETSGPNRWRMQRKPMAILENLCALQNWKKPQISPKTELIVNKCTFKIDNKCDWKNDDKIQNIALQILRKLRLTREHVETRTLYNPAKPQIATGRLQMWIDKWLIR